MIKVLQHRLQSARWKPALAAGIAAATVAAGLVAGASAYAAAGCRVDYSVPAQWPGGFTANVDVTNLGDPINGWSLVWTFPSGQQVTQAWNATVTAAGGHGHRDQRELQRGHRAPTATVSFGFNGSWSGSNTAPTSFALNGVTCTGSVGGTTAAADQPGRHRRRPPSTSPSHVPVAAAEQPDGRRSPRCSPAGTSATPSTPPAPTRPSWGNPPITQALLDHVKAQGFKSIRIPVTWGHHHGAAPSYTIDAACLNRVKEVVDWALADDLYVMINMHHDSWQWINTMPSDRTNVLNRYNAIWTQIAAAFRDHSPQAGVREHQRAAVHRQLRRRAELPAAARAQRRVPPHRARSRAATTPPGCWCCRPCTPTPTRAALDALRDHVHRSSTTRNLVATVHFYGFWPFSVNIAGFTRFNAEVQAGPGRHLRPGRTTRSSPAASR